METILTHAFQLQAAPTNLYGQARAKPACDWLNLGLGFREVLGFRV